MLKKILANKSLMFVIAGVFLGILLIVLGSIKGNEDKKTIPEENNMYTSEELESYTVSLEKRISDIIEKIGGVSDVSVLVTIDGSKETVYATEGANKDYVIIKDSSGNENALQVMEINATVRGIAVVCNYGGNEALRREIIDMLSSLFSIGSNRISVMAS